MIYSRSSFIYNSYPLPERAKDTDHRLRTRQTYWVASVRVQQGAERNHRPLAREILQVDETNNLQRSLEANFLVPDSGAGRYVLLKGV